MAFIAVPNANAADQYAAYDNHSTTGMTELAGPNYVNQDYGYEVRIPPGLVAWTAAAPAPNHGFRILLGPKRSVEVDASCNSALLGSTEALADEAASEIAGTRKTKSRTDLGGHPAERVALAGPGDRRRVLIVQNTVDIDRPAPPRQPRRATGSAAAASAPADIQQQADAINVVISPETVAAHETSDKRILDALARSFAYTRGEP